MANTSYLIHFFGPDGVGKSTQARILAHLLQKRGFPIRVVRIRSGRTFASLLLMMLGLLLHSTITRGADGRIIKLHFLKPYSLNGKIWALIEFLSIIPIILLKVYLPLFRGKIVIAERFIIDTIVSIAYLINSPKWIKSNLSNMMFRIIPHKTLYIHLDCSYTSVLDRRGKEAESVEYFEFQRKLYESLSKKVHTFVLRVDTSSLTITETAKRIYRYVLNALTENTINSKC